MSTRFFKNSLFSRVLVFISIANFILASCPKFAYSENKFPADKLKPRAAGNRVNLSELEIELELERLSKQNTAWFDEVGVWAVPQVGGKNANLGELRKFIRDMIPNGFAVTVKGFKDNLQQNPVDYQGKRVTLGDYIYARTKGLDYKDEKVLTIASNDIEEKFIAATMPKDVEADIRKGYASLCRGAVVEDVPVAVRSSATAEDLPEASFAGQQATFLNVRGIDNVLLATKKCWASLYEQRAMFYRHNQGISEDKAFLSVAIQLMVDAQQAGVMFTVDIQDGSPGIEISANPGLGEAVVSGETTPDLFKFVNNVKTGLPKLWRKFLGAKPVKTIKTKEGTKNVPTTPEEQGTFSLTDEEAERLAYAGFVIAKHYGRNMYVGQLPDFKRNMDIEWARDEKGQIKIVQARPDTVWSDNPMVLTLDYMQVPEKVAVEAKQKALVVGLPGSPRAGVGPATIIKNEEVKDAKGDVDKRATSEGLSRELAELKEGDTLVAPMTSPDFVAAMKRAAAIVTDKGGQTCHAGIVGRELGKPVVVGTKVATKVIKARQVVTTDAKVGYVADGELPRVKVEQVNDFRKYPKLKTKICLIMSDPDMMALLWKFGNYISYGGIGLVRDEQFLLSQILKHPQSVIDYDNYYDPNYKPQAWQHDKKWIKEHVIDIQGDKIRELIKGYPSFKDFYIEIKKNGLIKLAKAQAGGQSIKWRTSDFKSNEFRNLDLGPEYEPDEVNPMAGNRGLSRVLTPEFNEVFRLDLRALREARKVRSNIDVMFPVVRTPEDIRAVVQIMAEEGLFDGEDKPRIGIMVELASNVLMVEEMYQTLAELAAKYGTKAFMSIGSNDLTQFMLGVDRDSANMLQYANFWDPAVKKGIEILIKTAKRYDIETGICGEAPSKDPNFAAFLVECGIDSISVSPESYDAVVKVVEAAEKKLEGQPFDPTIKGWEYPSQLQVKQLPRIAAEKVDASTLIQNFGIHPLLLEADLPTRVQVADMLMKRELNVHEVKVLDGMDPGARAKIVKILQSSEPKNMVVEMVSSAILEKTKATDPSIAIIFATDTNKNTDYKSLVGGAAFETDEENPYLAFCGLVRVVDSGWEGFFRRQLQGVKQAREASGRKNIGISLNLPTTTKNIERALQIMKEEGLVPGEDGLLVGMEIDRGGHALILNQYLDLGLNFISENQETFVDYVLPEDPGNPHVNIPLDRKQRLFLNGQKIWTNIAAGREVPVPLAEFKAEEAVPARLPPAPDLGNMPAVDRPAVVPGVVGPTGIDLIRGARGADIGYITQAQHEQLRELLASIDARSEKYARHDLEDEFGVRGKIRIQSVPNMFKRTSELFGGRGIKGHYAIRDGIVYVDKEALESIDGQKYLWHEIDELNFLRKFAEGKGMNANELVEWLDYRGEVFEVLAVLTEAHNKAHELPREGATKEFIPDGTDKLVTVKLLQHFLYLVIHGRQNLLISGDPEKLSSILTSYFDGSTHKFLSSHPKLRDAVANLYIDTYKKEFDERKAPQFIRIDEAKQIIERLEEKLAKFPKGMRPVRGAAGAPAGAPDLGIMPSTTVPFIDKYANENLEGVRVFERVDFNVSDSKGKIKDEERIIQAIPSIVYLMERKATVILASHNGRPDGKVVKELSLGPVAVRLEELLKAKGYNYKVVFHEGSITEKGLKEGLENEIVEGAINVLENTRFCPLEEKDKDGVFAKALANLAHNQIFVFDAFGTAERVHASTGGIAEFMEESAFGFLMEKEIRYLLDALKSLNGIIIGGGPKMDQKIPMIKNVIKNIKPGGFIFIGSGPIAAFLKAEYDINVGNGAAAEDVKNAKEIIRLAEKSGVKLIMGADYLAADRDLNAPIKEGEKTTWFDLKQIPEGTKIYRVAFIISKKDILMDVATGEFLPADKLFIYDIGEDSIETARKAILSSPEGSSIVWNGSIGMDEYSAFENGSKGIAQAGEEAHNKGIVFVVGGGDTVASVKKFKAKVTHVSTGGGASFALLQGKKLQVVEALEKIQPIINKAKALAVKTNVLRAFKAADKFVYDALAGKALGDFVGTLRNFFTMLRQRTANGEFKNMQLSAEKIADSRGKSTVRAVLKSADGLETIGEVPAGASKGGDEAVPVSTEQAIKNINEIIWPMLRDSGLDINKHSDLLKADALLAKAAGKKFSVLGANATVPVSWALWRMAAKLNNMELADYIRWNEPEAVSDGNNYFYMNIYNGGLHALKTGEELGRDRIDIQEIMIAPVGAKTHREALEMGDKVDQELKKILEAKYDKSLITRADESGFSVKGLGDSSEAIAYVMQAIGNAGYTPGKDVKLCLDVAATTMLVEGKEEQNIYKFRGQEVSADDLITYYTELAKKYEGLIISIEDGLAENDWTGWAKLKPTMKKNFGIETIGDDLFVTQMPRFTRGIENDAASAILIKVNQNGTVTGTLEVIKYAIKNGKKFVISHRSGETLDNAIADLAFATKALGLKTGAPQPRVDFPDETKLVRRVKYDRMIALQEGKRFIGKALIVGPEFFNTGGVITLLQQVAELDKDIKIVLYGAKSQGLKLLLGNDAVITADTLDNVLVRLKNLGISSENIFFVGSSGDIQREGIATQLKREKVRGIIGDQISTLVIARAIKELANNKDADDAFGQFYSALADADKNVIYREVYSLNKQRMLRKLDEGIELLPPNMEMTKDKSDETREAREAVADFMDKL